MRIGRGLAVLGPAALSAAALYGPADAAARAPLLTVKPLTGTPGTRIHAVGRGFCAAGCSRVQIRMYGLPVARGIRVSPRGVFRAVFRIPGGVASGIAGVTAVQRRRGGGEISAFAQLQIVVEPAVESGRPPSNQGAGDVIGPKAKRQKPAETTASSSKPETKTDVSERESTDPEARERAMERKATGQDARESDRSGATVDWLGGGLAVAVLVTGGWLLFRRRRRSA